MSLFFSRVLTKTLGKNSLGNNISKVCYGKVNQEFGLDFPAQTHFKLDVGDGSHMLENYPQRYKEFVNFDKERAQGLDKEIWTDDEGRKFDVVTSIVLERDAKITTFPFPYEFDYSFYKNAKDEIYAPFAAGIKKPSFYKREGYKPTPEKPENKMDWTDQQILDQYPAPSRMRPADFTDNRKTLDRDLSKKLYLIVKKDRQEYSWQLPQGRVLTGETMREATERQLEASIGSAPLIYYAGNAPNGLIRYDLNEEEKKKKGVDYRKVFLNSAVIIDLEDPEYDWAENIVDHAWVSKHELHEYLNPQDMLYSTLMKIVIPDRWGE